MVVFQACERQQVERNCLMQLRLRAENEDEVRFAVNSMVGLANEVWLTASQSSTQIAGLPSGNLDNGPPLRR